MTTEPDIPVTEPEKPIPRSAESNRPEARFQRAAIVLLAFALVPFARPAWSADGQDIVANGNGQGAPACSACHGPQGAGNPETGYPRLAGLNSAYLVHELASFADGSRANEIMQPIAKALTPEERQAVAAFYSAEAPPKTKDNNTPDEKSVARGEELALEGDWSKGLPGCGQCHGPAGQGVGEAFPALAGQPAAYIQGQLAAWKEGKRTNDPLHLMSGIVTKLSDQDVDAVSAYYASLPVPVRSARQEAPAQQERSKP